MTFDYVGVSEYVVRDFFFIWIKHWSTVKFGHYVKMPTTQEELRRCEAEYGMGGLCGCIGSSDVCHVAWDRCRASMNNAATGKEGFPTLAFQIIVNHRRRILATTGAFLGATNDKSIARLDPAFTEIHEGSGCARNFKFNLFDSRGRAVEHKGAYLLVDGGYHKWSVLMDPIHRPTSRTLAKSAVKPSARIVTVLVIVWRSFRIITVVIFESSFSGLASSS